MAKLTFWSYDLLWNWISDLYSRNTFRKICNYWGTVSKVSSLEIFSHKNIISNEGIINLTNYKALYAQSLNQGSNRSLRIVR